MFIVDSWASFNIVCRSDLTEQELRKVHKAPEPQLLYTANGVTTAEDVVEVCIHDLDIVVEAYILEDTPSVVSMADICDKHGYDYVQRSKKRPYLQKGSGPRIYCTSLQNVP